MPTKKNFLDGTRVYLSGPMDFVASREEEKARGWRSQITRFLTGLGCSVFDPWNKPRVRALQGYGKEDQHSVQARETWSFSETREGAEARAQCAGGFWETVHIDLRMVDVSDFLIAYVPTNIYSVGTPHEIIVARQQHKPVLFVSPRVEFPSLEALKTHLGKDKEGLRLLEELTREVPIKTNPRHIPSLWYMPILGLDHFFDGFGFGLPQFAGQFPDAFTEPDKLQRPLLGYLQRLSQGETPKRWNSNKKDWENDDDWIILDSCLHDPKS